MDRCHVPHYRCFPKITTEALKSLNLSNPVSDSEITFIIPHKDHKKDFRRRINLESVVHYYRSNFPGSEILVVEQFEYEPTYQSKLVKKIDFQGSRLNKPKMLNLGWANSTNNIVIFCDNDLLLETISIRNCATLIRNGEFDLITPYILGVFLPDSEKFFGSDLSVLKKKFSAHVIPSPLCGGSFVTTKDFYYKFGGFDESFEGWGPEDSAASIKAINTGKCSAYLPGIVFHLYHITAQQNQDQFNEIKAKSEKLFDNLISLDSNQFEELIQKHRDHLSQYLK